MEKIDRKTKLKIQQLKKKQAKLVNKIKLLGALLPVLYICVYGIYKLYKHYTAKKESVNDENNNGEEDLQEEFFIEENPEY